MTEDPQERLERIKNSSEVRVWDPKDFAKALDDHKKALQKQKELARNDPENEGE